MDIKFEAGINIAIKIPKSKYDKTVEFYKNILKLEVEEKHIDNPTISRTHEVKFGNNIIWLDCVQLHTFRNLVTAYSSRRRRSEKLFTIERSRNL